MTNWYESIPAPTDSNGRLVPLDTKELVHNGVTREVYSFLYSIRLKCWFVEFWERVDICVSSCTMPDSWERLEADVERLADGYDVCDYFKGADRKAYDCGHEDGFCCDLCVARDILRRARGLAGMDAND